MAEVITQCDCGQLPALETDDVMRGTCALCAVLPGYPHAENCPNGQPCEACGAESGEECRPMCIGQAAHDDELGESAGCSCCQARSLAGQACHECARCGHLGKYHVTCNRPLPGTAHVFSEEPDAIYQHLTRAHCSCGWTSGGYSKIARKFWDTHVQTVGAAPQ